MTGMRHTQRLPRRVVYAPVRKDQPRRPTPQHDHPLVVTSLVNIPHDVSPSLCLGDAACKLDGNHKQMASASCFVGEVVFSVEPRSSRYDS